jgi:hypothetical protein
VHDCDGEENHAPTTTLLPTTSLPKVSMMRACVGVEQISLQEAMLSDSLSKVVNRSIDGNVDK